MDESAARARRVTRAALPLLVAALAVGPLAVARTLPPAELASAGLGWVPTAVSAALAGTAAGACLAWLVRGLRSGALEDLLVATASAALLGAAAVSLTDAGPAHVPVLGAAVLLVAAAASGRMGTTLAGRRARVVAAAGLLVAAELSIVVALTGPNAPVPTVSAGLASGASLVATLAGAGRPVGVMAAATLVGAAGLALDRGVGPDALVGLEGLGGLVALAGAPLLGLALPVERGDEAATPIRGTLPALTSGSADAVLRFDGGLRLHDWNAAAASLLGLDAMSVGTRLEDLLGIRLAELPRHDTTPTVHEAIGGLQVELSRSNGGLTAVVRDPGEHAPSEAERLGHELRGTLEELLQARRTIELQRRELDRATTVDRLTGVPTRASVLDRLRIEVAQGRRYEHPVAVVLLDVDRFGELNRAAGTAGGDAILREVALRIRLRVREADALGRVGGDSFLAVLPHTDESGAATFANALRHRIGLRPFVVEGEPMTVSLSIGIAVMRPDEELDVDALLARAEEALSSARGGGGDRIALDRLHGLARLEDHRPGPSGEEGGQAEA